MTKVSRSAVVNALRETPIIGCDLLPTIHLSIPSSVEANEETIFLQLSKEQQLAKDPERYFSNKLSLDSGFLSTPSNSVPYESLSWSICNNARSLVLTPIVLTATHVKKEEEYAKIQVDLPEKIRKHCVILRFEEVDDKQMLVIDLITENGILVTLSFAIKEDFQLASSRSLVEDWCFVSIPYDFDVREPHYLRSITSNSFLLFFKDGGIIKCSRRSFKENVTTDLFTDTSYVSSALGRFGKFLPLGKNQDYDEDESNYNIPKGYTLKTNLDGFIINKKYLVTISFNRKLKVWSLATGTLLSEKKIILETAELNHKLIGDGSPSCLLAAFGGEDDKNVLVDGDEFFFVSYLPIGDGQFKVWKLQIDVNGRPDLVDLGLNFEYTPIIPDQSSIWLVQDFKVIDPAFLNANRLFYADTKPWLNVMILLKSNTSSVHQLLTVFENGEFTWVKSNLNYQLFPETHPNNFPLSNSQTLSEYYIIKTLNSNKYPSLVVEAGLSFFEKKYSESAKDLPIDLPIKEKVITIVSSSSEGLTKLWQKFDSICQELLKITNESLSLNYIKSTGTVYLSKVYEYSVIRTSEAVEILYLNKQKLVSNLPLLSTPGNPDYKQKTHYGISNDAHILRFLNVLSSFKNSLSSDILTGLKTQLLHSFKSPVQSDDIFNECLAGKISETSLQSLMEDLNSIPGAFQIIGYFLEYPYNQSFEKYLTHNPEYLQTIQDAVQNGVHNSLFFVHVVKQMFTIFEDIYYNILLIVLILNFDKETSVAVLSKASAIYKRIHLVFATLSINFNFPSGNDSTTLNTDNLGNYYNSLFFRILIKHLKVSELKEDLSRPLFSFLIDDRFYFAVINELSATNNSHLVLDQILPYDPNPTSPVSQVFKGLTFLNTDNSTKAANILIKAAPAIASYLPPKVELVYVDAVYKFLKTKTLSEFYHSVAIAFQNFSSYTKALQFAKLAIAEFEKNESNSSDLTKKSYYLTLFNNALELQDFDQAFKALNELDYDPTEGDFATAKEIKHEALNGFIRNIIRSNDLKNLITYPFSPSDLIKIDEFLFSTANTYEFNFPSTVSVNAVNNNLNHGLKYFKILYSWRLNHGNIKGACESLYQYINKIQFLLNHPKRGKLVVDIKVDPKFHSLKTKQESIIRDLYLIVISLLDTIESADEKWLLKQNFAFLYDNKHKNIHNAYDIVKVEELKAELEHL